MRTGSKSRFVNFRKEALTWFDGVSNDGFAKKSPKWSLRAERSKLVFHKCMILWDCFVAALLAMTSGWTFYDFIGKAKSWVSQIKIRKWIRLMGKPHPDDLYFTTMMSFIFLNSPSLIPLTFMMSSGF